MTTWTHWRLPGGEAAGGEVAGVEVAAQFPAVLEGEALAFSLDSKQLLKVQAASIPISYGSCAEPDPFFHNGSITALDLGDTDTATATVKNAPHTVVSTKSLLVYTPIPDPDAAHLWVCHMRLAVYEDDCEGPPGDRIAYFDLVDLKSGKLKSQKAQFAECPDAQAVSVQSKRAIALAPPAGTKGLVKGFFPWPGEAYTHQLMDLSTGASLLEWPDTFGIAQPTLSPDGTLFAYTRRNDEGSESAQVEAVLGRVSEGAKGVWSVKHADLNTVRFSADGRLLLLTQGAEILAVDTKHPERPPTVLKGHTQRISTLSVGAQSNHLASAQWDGIVYVWDLNTVAASLEP